MEKLREIFVENMSMFIFVEGFKNRCFIWNREVIRHKSVKHNVIEAKRGENYKKQNAFDNAVEEISGWNIDLENCTEFSNF